MPLGEAAIKHLGQTIETESVPAGRMPQINVWTV